MCTRSVGALGHYFEEEGLATTQISLIRMHTEAIKPPRALWVPFELGRPLGIPDDPAFQKRVVLAALKLLEAPKGPVLEDYPEDAPVSENEITVLSCPVNFVQEKVELTETEKLHNSLNNEITSLRPWYDMGVEKKKVTTVGASKIGLNELGSYIFSFLGEELPENPHDDVPLGYAFKMAADDLKAYYAEAITAQPGQEYTSSQVLRDWFWTETVAGEVLLAIKEKHKNSEDKSLQITTGRLLVPGAVAEKMEKH